MRLVVFGVSGGTGGHLLRQALDAGHRVTAVARTPMVLPGHEGLTVVQGDVLHPEAWTAALAGHDAVLSCLGSAGRGRTTVYSRGMTSIVAAMQDYGVRRLAGVTSASLALAPDATPAHRLLIKYAVRPLYRHVYADMTASERIVASAGVEWTIVRPPRLTNGPRTGSYRTAVNGHLPHLGSLSRADLAHYLLALLDDPTTQRATVEISS